MHFSSSIIALALLATGRAVPLLATRCNANDCPPPPNNSPRPVFLKGYVAFGDSYAAGIGTGKTTRDVCRQGSYSYPQLLSATNAGVEFQNLACSGAVMSELIQGNSKSQIDKWKPDNTDLATLSITGNDVGFSEILMACVLKLFGRFSKDCDTALKNGQNLIADGDGSFKTNLGKLMVQIVDKSKQPDFRLVVTGYPQFFNANGDSCDDATFDFWGPSHDTTHSSKKQYLDKTLRSSLNDLVTNLNAVISGQVDAINQKYNRKVGFFIDPNTAFNNHRFCEDGVTEPAKDRPDTWFFLSAWPDNSLPSSNTASESDQDQQDEPAESIPIATADECTNVNQDDLIEQMRCDIASGDNSGTPNDVVLADGTLVTVNGTQGNFVNTTQYDVAWFKPTRYVKTFHPRTLGHDAYKTLIINALKQG